MKKLKFDVKQVHEDIVSYIKNYMNKIGFKKAIIGLSGGVDSALVAYLLRDAIGAENVLALMMPYKTSSKESLEHAKLVLEDTGIIGELVEITPMIDSYFEKIVDATPLRKGNKMARERMSILYDYSAFQNRIVIGTSNKTERMLGYSTQFGDSACAMNPIGDLYKTQIWELSRYLGVPKVIIDKKPSADLWEGQTDEEELGLTYELADKILFRLVEEKKSLKEVISEGYDKDIVEKIVKKIKFSEFKRHMPEICEIQKNGE